MPAQIHTNNRCVCMLARLHAATILNLSLIEETRKHVNNNYLVQSYSWRSINYPDQILDVLDNLLYLYRSFSGMPLPGELVIKEDF